MDKSADAFRTISEVAEELEVHKHVLRFWEVRFPQIKPMKRGGGRRYYRPADLELLRGIRHLLHNEGYTIKGVQKILREQGVDSVKSALHLAATAAAKPAATAASKSAGRTALAAGAKVRAARPASPRDRKAAIAIMIRELEAAREILVGKSAKPQSGRAVAGATRARR